MKKYGHLLTYALAGAALLTPAAIAQSAQQPSQDPYQGVSQPPADDAITTTPDTPPAPAKPSAAIPATTAPAAPAAEVAAKPAQATTQPENPDYGIVTSPVADATPAPAARSNDATLQKRPYNPDDDIVSMVPSPSGELAQGTNIRVHMLDNLSTKQTESGSPFKGTVAADVYKEGRVIIPAGSELRGRVVGVTQGHHLGSPATLHLRPDVVILPDGTAYHLYAHVVQSQAPGTRTDSEGGIQPSSHLKKNAIEYGAGVGTGALVGAKIAGPHGALVGSVIGAGVISAHLLMQHPSAVEVPKGSTVTFSLTEPMGLTPTRN